MSASKDGSLLMGKVNGDLTKDLKVKQWKQRWIVLCGSSLYYYSKKTSFAPTGNIETQKLSIVDDNIKSDKKNVFAIVDKDKGRTYIFSCNNEEERQSWLTTLTANKDQDPSPPPNNTKEKKGVKYSFEANVASTMLGKKIAKESIPAEAWQVLEHLCRFIGEVQGNETAQAFKKSLLKLATKIGLLHNNKYISDEEILKWRQTFLKLGTIVVDFYQMPSIFDCKVVTKFLTDMQSGMETKLKPLLTAKSIDKINYLFSVLNNEELVINFFTKKKWKELETIAMIIRANSNAKRENLP